MPLATHRDLHHECWGGKPSPRAVERQALSTGALNRFNLYLYNIDYKEVNGVNLHSIRARNHCAISSFKPLHRKWCRQPHQAPLTLGSKCTPPLIFAID